MSTTSKLGADMLKDLEEIRSTLKNASCMSDYGDTVEMLSDLIDAHARQPAAIDNKAMREAFNKHMARHFGSARPGNTVQQWLIEAFNAGTKLLAASTSANVAQGAEAQSGRAVAMDDDELAEFRQTAEDFEDNGETSTPYDILMNWAERGFMECTHFELTAEGKALLGEPIEVVHFASPKNLADPAKD